MLAWLRRIFGPKPRPGHLHAAALTTEQVRDVIRRKFYPEGHQPVFPYAAEVNAWAAEHCPEALTMPAAAGMRLCAETLGLSPWPVNYPAHQAQVDLIMAIRSGKPA
jgi:hypothetical protein